METSASSSGKQRKEGWLWYAKYRDEEDVTKSKKRNLVLYKTGLRGNEVVLEPTPNWMLPRTLEA